MAFALLTGGAAAAAPAVTPSGPQLPGTIATGRLPALSMTRERVEATQNASPEFQAWQHALTVDFTHNGGFAFRASSSNPAAKGLRWELRSKPFLGGEGSLLDHGTVATTGALTKWQRFEVAFGALAPPPVVMPSAASKMAGKPAVAKTSALRSAPRRYELRVFAVDGAGKVLGPASKPVQIVHGPKARTEVTLFPDGLAPPKPPKPAKGLHAHIDRYEPIQFATSDAWKRWVVTTCAARPGTPTKFPYPSTASEGPPCSVMPIGKAFVWDPTTKSSKDPVAAVGEAITDALAFAADAIDWASAAYADIKKAVVSTVAGVIPYCDSTCSTLLAGALDTGLAALGVPPSLPNFEQLTEMGEDYLVQLVAEEVAAGVGPLTAELAAAGTRKLIDGVRKGIADAQAHGPGGNRWFKPDPAYQHRDAYIVVTVTNDDTVAREDTMLVRAWGTYESVYVPVPRMKPGATLKVPVMLQPDLQYWFERGLRESGGVDRNDELARWRAAYDSGNAELSTSLASAPGGGDALTCKARTRCTH
ncbi:MAG: hypothetical protein IPH07_06955 [Deltaproteobacteria bacterium]|nr:hypothetical protein [Deltaproteobacteria bacterium]MBK8717905.1 hypothetical protein [Deltaproteobacteria bacterium]MBP7288303.1 hypothetical protein [Nannocystaceae bacterium]